MKLTDVRCDVEEEREPADPVKELNLAYFANLRRETPCGMIDLLEECEHARLCHWWWRVTSGIPFGDKQA